MCWLVYHYRVLETFIALCVVAPCVCVVREKFIALCVVCVEPESPAEAESDPLAAQCVVHSVW